MRDGLAAGDRVQLHINNGRNKAYPQRPGLDQALSRGSDGRFLSRPGEVCFWQILLQKSFWGGDRKFPKPLMRYTRGEVRDHIVASKIDHAPL